MDRRTASAEWWNDAPIPNLGQPNVSLSPLSWFGATKFRDSLSGGRALHEGHFSGYITWDREGFLRTLAHILSARLVYTLLRPNQNGTLIFSSAESMMEVSVEERGTYMDVNLLSTNRSLLEAVSKLVASGLQQSTADPTEGHVYIMAANMSGYSISHIGSAGTPLVRSNYTKEVLDDYDFVVKDLNSDFPSGRLSVFSGDPGTGKTYLIRSLLRDCPTASFVFIPPHLIEGLSTPEILPSLTSAKREMSGNIVLVLEDADHCLVPRKEGNMGAISSLLNLGDGILGSVLDLRIVATTNATDIELDPATKRPGRLSRHVHVNALDQEAAQNALKVILGKPVRLPTRPATLAQIYATARRAGWVPPPKKKRELNPERPVEGR